MNDKDLVYYTSLVAIVFMVCSLLLVGYLCLIDGNDAITHPNRLMKATIKDNHINVEVEQCKKTDKPATVYVSYVNNLIYNLAPETVAGTPIGCGIYTKMIEVPLEIPDGTYFLNVKRCYDINFLKTVCGTYQTERFIIKR